MYPSTCKNNNEKFLCKECYKSSISWYLWRVRNNYINFYKLDYPPRWLKTLRKILIITLLKHKKIDKITCKPIIKNIISLPPELQNVIIKYIRVF
uniref:Uncharacterized protein n=1 Tax=viral metagenome TaxID=1070528 RepID=A0A6C0LLA9_9ZZZZ